MPLEFTPGAEGVFHNLPAEVYHKAPGVSNSMLRHMTPPARLPAYLAKGKKQTPAMLFGSVVHHLVLTPLLEPFWIVSPYDEFRTTEAKKWKAEQTKSVVTASEIEDATAAAASVMAHKEASGLLAGAQTEISVFCRASHLINPVLCKARIDIAPPLSVVLGDLKTCQRADEESFGKDIESGEYHCQGGWYLDIWNAIHWRQQKCPVCGRAASWCDTLKSYTCALCGAAGRTVFKIVAVEKEPPFLVNVAPIDAEDINQGREQNTMRQQSFSICSKLNEWDGHPLGGTFRRPHWARTAQQREDRRAAERAILQNAEKRLMDSAAMEVAA